jgi:crotonobetainyl-CoA:carnitine CoA-transferase CaiB-like acyl-CoA transferase
MVLAGIRVLDAGSFVAGPAATVMGDFGAEVIKIEPPEGDPYRSLHRLPGSPESDRDYYWTMDSRNKKSLALDLKRPEARDVLTRLVRSADVFLTNMPLDVRARLGIRWPDLEPLNGRLVYASVTAYGEIGPEMNKTGFDATAWWARTGLMDHARSSPGAAPARSIPGMGDHATAMALFGAMMLALYLRERTGKGGHGVDVPDGGRPLVERDARAGASLRRNDPAAPTAGARAQCAREHVPMRRRSLVHARGSLGGAAVAGVAKLEDLTGDRQMLETGALMPLCDPDAGAALTVNSPAFYDGAAKVAAGRAPRIGEHTDEVLRSSGLDEREIQALLRAGVVTGAPQLDLAAHQAPTGAS